MSLRISVAKLAIIVFLATLLLRGMVCYARFDNFVDDPDRYAAIATTIHDSGVFGIQLDSGGQKPTAFRPPLYPYLLSLFSRLGSLDLTLVAVLHSVLGAITVASTFLIAVILLERPTSLRIPLLAAALAAIDPILVQQSTLVMTETLATMLATLGILAGVHIFGSQQGNGRWLTALLLGGVLALAYLCRPTFLVWAGLIGMALLVSKSAGGWKRRILVTALAIVPVMISLGIWTLRNQKTMGHPVWATTHGGYTLLLANNPSFYEYLRTGRMGFAWDANQFIEAHKHRYSADPNEADFWQKDWTGLPVKAPASGIGEVEDDRVCYEAARATIDRQGGMFVWSCVVRCARLWSPFPHQTEQRGWTTVAVAGVYYVLFYIAAIIGIMKLGKRLLRSNWWPVWTLAIALSGVHAVYWSNLRMRAPIVPALAILAAAALLRRPKASGR